jgi:hypothetical protein
MDTLRAFAMGQANKDKGVMVFDWDKAARRIRETNAHTACAGLRDDWEWTGGTIYASREPIDEYTYLASTWAVPELELDGKIEECYRMQSEVPDWGPDTKWPESALKILRGEE